MAADGKRAKSEQARLRARVRDVARQREQRRVDARQRDERATTALRMAHLGIPVAAETAAIPPSLAEVMSWDA